MQNNFSLHQSVNIILTHMQLELFLHTGPHVLLSDLNDHIPLVLCHTPYACVTEEGKFDMGRKGLISTRVLCFEKLTF